MTSNLNTNKNTIKRLLKYKSVLYRLKSLGFIKVFSDNLGDAIDVPASQVRKDFSLFKISGSRRGGYNIDELIVNLNKILGKNEIQKIIIVGTGNIGKALINYKTFEQDGLKIVAGFDINPAKLDKKNEIPILPLDEMHDFIKKNNIKIGIIAVPSVAARQVLDIMLDAGVKGVLNFSQIGLKASGECIINDVNLVLELENLIYHVDAMGKTS